jgi:hypothetical protein
MFNIQKNKDKFVIECDWENMDVIKSIVESIMCGEEIDLSDDEMLSIIELSKEIDKGVENGF